MKLFYYKGNNFGDQLNPLIFNKVLRGFFDGNDDEVFVGIGSILGFDDYKHARKKYIFSSGIAKGNTKEYGKIPIIDRSYEFICVRGPLTAKLLGLDPQLAVTDGGALIKVLDLPAREKKFDYSFVPHKNTVFKFDWKTICESTGINYISPLEDVDKVINGIMESRVVLAEALHAAIVADALRIPWIPFKTFHSINSFKWTDWAMSVELPYRPNLILTLFGEKPLDLLVQNNIRSAPLSKLLVKNYLGFQDRFILPRVSGQLERLKKSTQYLSDEKLFSWKIEVLLDKISKFQAKKSSS